MCTTDLVSRGTGLIGNEKRDHVFQKNKVLGIFKISYDMSTGWTCHVFSIYLQKLTLIPLSIFYSEEHKHYGDKFVRVCFAKVNIYSGIHRILCVKFYLYDVHFLRLSHISAETLYWYSNSICFIINHSPHQNSVSTKIQSGTCMVFKRPPWERL